MRWCCWLESIFQSLFFRGSLTRAQRKRARQENTQGTEASPSWKCENRKGRAKAGEQYPKSRGPSLCSTRAIHISEAAVTSGLPSLTENMKGAIDKKSLIVRSFRLKTASRPPDKATRLASVDANDRLIACSARHRGTNREPSGKGHSAGLRRRMPAPSRSG